MEHCQSRQWQPRHPLLYITASLTTADLWPNWETVEIKISITSASWFYYAAVKHWQLWSDSIGEHVFRESRQVWNLLWFKSLTEYMQGLKLHTALFKYKLKVNFCFRRPWFRVLKCFTQEHFYNGILSWTDALAVKRDANWVWEETSLLVFRLGVF